MCARFLSEKWQDAKLSCPAILQELGQLEDEVRKLSLGKKLLKWLAEEMLQSTVNGNRVHRRSCNKLLMSENP